MAFADPQTVTVNAIAKTLPRVAISDSKGVFRKDDGEYTLQITSTGNGKRERMAIRIDQTKTAADPLFPSTNVPSSISFTLVCDRPVARYTLAEQKQIVDGFLAYLTASSGAKITQLLGGEI